MRFNCKNRQTVILVIMTIFVLVGCQKDVVNNAQKMVDTAEKQGMALKKEVDYAQREKTYKDKAFSAPKEILIQTTTKDYNKAVASLKGIKDEKTKKELENRLDKVQSTLNDAKLFNKAIQNGVTFGQAKTAFIKYVSENALSNELDGKLADFQKQADEMNKFKGTIKDKSLQQAIQANVIGDSDQQIQTAKTVISARNGINELAVLIASNGSKDNIDKKSNEVKTLIAQLATTPMKTTLDSKENEVLQPYIEKVKAENTKTVASSNSTVSTTTASSNQSPTVNSNTSSSDSANNQLQSQKNNLVQEMSQLKVQLAILKNKETQYPNYSQEYRDILNQEIDLLKQYESLAKQLQSLLQ